ncbi:hypothetical protein AWZ03_004753 [Drosophila navojoa]|uniref:RHD domain-containing protein n=1 Tax=Drosophila navojoa TaxID=7232 RepID=A0A484BLD2_DRONA|nr:nuclear factor NF-kappa-B p110 subunit [Drosophila navojoa]TDG48850.1 hypothetical protein AWZ03_004753 [Drosophila navojoa]
MNQQQFFDLDQGKNISYMNDCSSTSGYSSANSPISMTQSPSHSPETFALQNEFANLNLPAMSNSPSPQLQQLRSSPYQQPLIANQLLPSGNLCMEIDGGSNNILNGNTNFGNMYMPMDHFYATPQNVGFAANDGGVKHEYTAVLHIVEQPVEKFRFRYKSEMHGTHGSLNGINSKRTPKTFPEVMLRNYNGPAVIRCSLFQTNLDSPHSHQLVVRKDERDVCDPHDLHVSQERGYVAQFINMGIIHTAKKFIFDELLKKKKDRLVFKMGRRELSTKQVQELHQETEREAKEMNLNQVRLCFEAFKIEDNQTWTPIAAPVYSNPINNRKSAQTGELRITRLSKPTGSVMGNDELILLVEKVSKKNIKVRFFEENDDGETVWEAYAKFRESDVHHQYAIVCQTPPYKDKDVEREVGVSIELIRPSDDERSFPPLPFRYKPRDAIVSRKRRRTCSTLTSSSGSSSGSLNNSMELPKTVPQQGVVNVSQHDQTISQEFGREFHLEQLINPESFRKILEQDSAELEKLCVTDIGVLETDGQQQAESADRTHVSRYNRNLTSTYLGEIFKIFDAARRAVDNKELFQSSCKKVENLFTDHAQKNVNNDTLLHEVISQRKDNVKLAIKMFQVIDYFKLRELAHTAQNADGDSCLHVACQQDRDHYIRPLLGLGCSPNQQNLTGNTPLHLAVKEDRNNCIKLFLDASGAKLDLSLTNDDGLTPLHMAIRQNKYDVAKNLINYDRSSINVANTTDGNNALHMAVLEQNVELIVLILDAENRMDILMSRNSAGLTPLQLARAKANDRCVRLLEEVYPDKGECAMTWIPLNIKEEMDSSSAEDDEESNSEVPAQSIKTEEFEMDFKAEYADEDSTTNESDVEKQLQQLLSSKPRFDKLVAQLNEPTADNANLPKWKEIAEKSDLKEFSWLWSSSEGMLNYIQNKSGDKQYKHFALALQELGFLSASN